MKTIRITFLFILICGLNIKVLNAQVSQQDAWNIVKNEVLNSKIDNINVSVSKTIIDSKSIIKTWYEDEISPISSSWFFFIDDMPFEGWSHPCRYVYVDSKSGKVIIKNKKLPPLIDMKPLIEKKIYTKGKLFDLRSKKTKNVSTATNDYAVIISGGGYREKNFERYWNDCSAIYKTLVNIYGYSDNHIYVLMSDGTSSGKDLHMNDGSYKSSPLDLDGDGDNDIQYSATKSNITKVFDKLKNTLTKKDNLFIYTTDHGYQVSGKHVIMYFIGVR